MKRSLEDKLEDANNILSIQKDSYDYDPYMHGMYNGMELMLSIFEEREPKFLDAPETWTSKQTTEKTLETISSEQQ